MSAFTRASPELRDPAWSRRLFWVLAGAVLLAPMLVATEFKPWILFERDNLAVTLRFVGDFLPPRLDGEFLALVAREARRTVATATVGKALALLLAIPLTLLSTAALSVSALAGRMNVRQLSKDSIVHANVDYCAVFLRCQ